MSTLTSLKNGWQLKGNNIILIRQIVTQALIKEYLTVEAEHQLRQLLQTKYGEEDLDAFFTLQDAAMTGRIRQESRENLVKLLSR
jgi:hypothetical protein